jgi:8-oxo-dGTP pyrophosphatase MutT (NUDIX family)
LAELLPDDVYAARTPKKRIASSLLCFDDAARILIVKPTYRTDWLLPGGMTEKDEAPATTALREASEELGIAIKPLRLLCVMWQIKTRLPGDSLNFIFEGGRLDTTQIAQIQLPADELSEYRFVSFEVAALLLPSVLATGVKAALRALNLGQPIYVEEERFF